MYKKLVCITALSVMHLLFAADKGKNVVIPFRTTQGYRTDEQILQNLFGKGKKEYQKKTVTDLMRDPNFVQADSAATVHLDLSRQGLTSLEGLNQYPSIHEVISLNLAENLLEQISPQDLEHMPHLVALVLSYNMISELPANIFSNLRSLRVVILSNNGIKDIDADAFLDCRLEIIDLSNNNLRSFDPDLVSDQRGLWDLRLSYNNLPASNLFHLVREFGHFNRLEL